jgi:hypothetical protein
VGTTLFHIEGYLEIPYQKCTIESNRKREQQPKNMVMAVNPFIKTDMTLLFNKEKDNEENHLTD